jgi:4'-phosphopantetheinyl transferase
VAASRASGQAPPIALAGKSARLWIVELDCTPGAVRRASEMLPAAELERCRSVIDPRRRRRLILARATLRQTLAKELALEPARVEMLTGRDGKPALASTRGLSFSLSHTGRWAAIAVSEARSVGVDIEPLDRHVTAGLVRRVLTPAELGLVLALPAELRDQAFLAHWTAKEAAAKVLGGGLAGNLPRLELRDALTAPRLADPRLDAVELRLVGPHRALIGALAATDDTAIMGGA